MTPARWQRIRGILDEALECAAQQRQALLERECADDGELRAEVDSLIAAYEKGDGESLFGLSAGFDEMLMRVPHTIGPYRLQRELGSGGMGQVWLAEQTEPVRRQVAIKVIRAGLYDSQVLKRFLSERQSLALMNHPAIAKIFDAGATPDGRPYLVMEYVDGCPITDYCDRHALSIAQRLQLFQLVCEGVQHAHQKAIIHRDLKPSNILVTQVDAKPVPQIIDFGVAKELSGALEAKTLMTQIGTLIGTPGYMSPEQATLDAEDVDTRTDVYTLGVILYELLVGTLPLDPPKSRSFESLHRSAHAEARKPSTKLTLTSHESAKVAKARGTEIAVLLRQLRGDLDSIALKALDVDRTRRYATPSEFAADIGRYLRNEPVLAHAPSAAYQARKYLRRHWAGAALLSAVLALLLAFAVAQSLQLRRIRLERDRADQITGFMTQIFKVPDPSEARGNTVTAREILDKSSRQIESGVGLDAGVQSDLLQVMAETYQNLGLYARAHELAERAFNSRRQRLGPDNPRTLESMLQLGNILFLEGQTRAAEDLFRRTLALQVRILGPEHLQTLKTQYALLDVMLSRGSYEEAERRARDLIAVETRTLGSQNPLTLNSEKFLASALRHQSRFVEAEALYRQTLKIQLHVLGADHPDTLKTQNNLASMLQEQGRYLQAEVVYRDALKVQRRVLGDEHPETADTMTHIAIAIYHDPSRYSEAEQLFRAALAIEMRQVGPESRFTTRAEEGLANLLLLKDGNEPEGERLFREVLRVRVKVLGPDNTDTLLTQYNLADLLNDKGQHQEAERLLRSILEQQTRLLGPDDPDVLASKSMLAATLLRQNRAREAEPLAREAFDSQLRVLGPQHSDTQTGLAMLARSLTALGRYDEAKALCLSTIDKIKDQPGSTASTGWYNFADVAALSAHPDDAFDALDHAIELGYANPDHVNKDDDLKYLHHDPRFAKILERVANNAAPPH